MSRSMGIVLPAPLVGDAPDCNAVGTTAVPYHQSIYLVFDEMLAAEQVAVPPPVQLPLTPPTVVATATPTSDAQARSDGATAYGGNDDGPAATEERPSDNQRDELRQSTGPPAPPTPMLLAAHSEQSQYADAAPQIEAEGDAAVAARPEELVPEGEVPAVNGDDGTNVGGADSLYPQREDGDNDNDNVNDNDNGSASDSNAGSIMGQLEVGQAEEEEDDYDNIVVYDDDPGASLITPAAHSIPAIIQKTALWESLDLDRSESAKSREESTSRGRIFWKQTVLRWGCVVLIALVTAAVSFALDTGSGWLRKLTMEILARIGDGSTKQRIGCGLVYVVFGITYIGVAGVIVLLFDPTMRGATSDALCYLNGIVVENTLKVKKLVAHSVALLFVTASPMCVGKQDPSLAIGAQIGYASSKIGSFHNFFDEYDVRDMVSIGLGAGVATSFGAPAGAVLFTLENGFHFTTTLLQQLLLCCMLACFALSFLLSGHKGDEWGAFTMDSLCHFGQFTNSIFNIKQLIAFMLMGIVGGLLGALFNFLHLLTIRFRRTIFKTPRKKFFEILVITLMTGIIAVVMSSTLSNCVELSSESEVPDANNVELQTIFCPTGYYNQMATMFMNSQESALHFLLHEKEVVDKGLLAAFAVTYLALSVYSIGSGVPSGYFMPTLLLGATVGRLVGEMAKTSLSKLDIDPGIMAYIGSAAVFGGVSRMTISLAVILSEAVNQATWSLFLAIALIISRWIGDMFNPGIAAMDFKLTGHPVLPWSAPRMLYRYSVTDAMHSPVVSLPKRVTPHQVQRILDTTTHNGFAVVGDWRIEDIEKGMTQPLCGVITRKQLDSLLRAHQSQSQEYIGEEAGDQGDPELRQSNDGMIDLEPHARHVITVPSSVSCARAFNIFRSLGLRHLIVVDGHSRPVGMITRKDLFSIHRVLVAREKRLQHTSVSSRIRAALYGSTVH
ncbi:chloride transport protein 6 [Pelomyxa schiedti]|nr:chloride transport protein 6 [Pelomyxa schiedti]